MKKTIISSKSNPWVQQWLRYRNKPNLRKTAQLIWLEGEHLVIEALKQLKNQDKNHTSNQPFNLFSLLEIIVPKPVNDTLTDNYVQNIIGSTLFNSLLKDTQLTIHWIYLEESIYKSLCTMDSLPRICAVLKIDTLLSIDTINYQTTTVVLDEVQDPGNVGTIIRLCTAFGITQIILSNGCANAWHIKTLRAGQGAQFYIKIYEQINLQKLYTQFKISKVPIIVTSVNRTAIPLNQMPISHPMVWVFGNEGQGVSKISQMAANKHVLIPMQGQFESLNVGSAAAICLWTWQNYYISGVNKNISTIY